MSNSYNFLTIAKEEQKLTEISRVDWVKDSAVNLD